MKRLEDYIIRNFSVSFFSIFTPLFVIASIVFLVRLASITAVVELSTIDMIRMYLFILPELLFFTLPISFIVSGVSTLSKLSQDSEMVVFFTFGISPHQIMKIILKIAIYFTITLLIITFMILPHTEQLQKNFLHYKKTESVFNIKATEFGQKFGDWSLFIDSVSQKENEKIYNNVVLFYKDSESDEERFIIAKEAKILNSKGLFQLRLKTGTVFLYKGEKTSQLNFKDMRINDVTSFSYSSYLDTIEYIKYISKNPKKRTMFINRLTLSLLPVLSVMFILAFGIKYTRYGTDQATLYTIFLIIGYFVITFSVSKSLVYLTPTLMIFVSLIFGYFLYKKKVLNKY